jgi:malate synthase
MRARPAKRRAKVAASGRSARTAKAGSAKRRTTPKGKVRAGKGANKRVGRRAARSGRKPAALPGRLKRAARKIAGGASQPLSGVRGVKIRAAMQPRYAEILTPDALAFLAGLHRKFEARRQDLMKARSEKQKRFDAGELPDFLPETKWVRDGQWKIAPIPADLLDRRVEITGPVDRKMVINALNSGANVYLADFEDANSPTWDNNLEGQLNLKDRWHGRLDFTDPESGKNYKLGSKLAVMLPRPRGWHLLEEHLIIDGKPIAGGLFDFGLYFFHNARATLAVGSGPYFYLPKLETHQEARLWNDVFVHAQEALGLPLKTIKATVLIETLPAAFEMDEILWEMRDHITGLNAGRWDYIFSFVKKFARNKNYILPDRSQVVMGKAFLGAYAALLVNTCHRRGAFAMGGMAAQIPVKDDQKANDEAFAKVRADKEREVREGHDGTWVAHPALVPVAKEVFDRLMPQPNQLDKLRDNLEVTRDALLQLHDGTKTEAGFRLNIRVGVQYIAAWLGGRGAVPIYNLMEDAATAEISRAQIWQWLKYGATLDNGKKATPAFFRKALKEEMQRVKKEIGAKAYAAARFPEAIKLFSDLSLSKTFADFLTVPAYKKIK